MFKLVFADMDDTFVAPDKTIPAENLRVLDELAARGIGLVPCTGRSVVGLPPELLAHPCVSYAVCGGGALTYDVRANRPLAVELIDAATVRALYDEVSACACTFDLFTPDGRVLSSAERWPYFARLDVSEPLRQMLYSLRTRVDGTTRELVEATPEVCRITICCVGEGDVERVWEAARSHPELTSVSSTPCNVEITRAGVDKGSALRGLCERLGVDVADTVAFGDSGNDVAMLRAAGDGVAVANAVPACLEAADHVAPSCGEAGVARYLEGLLAAAR